MKLIIDTKWAPIRYKYANTSSVMLDARQSKDEDYFDVIIDNKGSPFSVLYIRKTSNYILKVLTSQKDPEYFL